MPRRRDPFEQDPQLTRKRTAHMLRRVRELTKDVRMLRARVRSASAENERQRGSRRKDS
jgi:hypothetical protein